jgi:DNA modification methylase
LQLFQGDSAQVLPQLTGLVDCVVTSPPYYNLRDYGTGHWVGGDSECDHSPEKRGGRFASPVSAKQASNVGSGTASSRDCPCGARRVDEQIGMEDTVDGYIRKLVDLFDAARHLLNRSATLWVNIGDSYADRQLLGIPWRFAFAMQQARFQLLADVIWSKPNAMPTSAKHRPTIAHEYVFMFGVSGKNYYGYDEVKEPMADSSLIRMKSPRTGEHNKGQTGNYSVTTAEYTEQELTGWRNMRSVWEIAKGDFPGAHYAVYPLELVRRCILAGCPGGGTVLDPFFGSGTTAVAARALSRRCIGIELSGIYCRDAMRRFQGRRLHLEEAGQISLFDLEVNAETAGNHQHDLFTGSNGRASPARPGRFEIGTAKALTEGTGADA